MASPRIVADVAPARVSGPGLEVKLARLVVCIQPSFAMLYTAEQRKPVLSEVVAYQQWSYRGGNGVLTIDDRSTWNVSRGSGCACGHPIRRAPVSSDLKKQKVRFEQIEAG